MASPAETLFDSLSTYQSIIDLIAAGEAEGQFLECKAPGSSQLDKGTKVQLAVAVSGFANSGGGVVILGVSTDNKLHTGLDVLTQTEPVGHCQVLARRIDRTIATLTTPAVACPPCRILLGKPTDTKGLLVLLVPPTTGDPIQCLEDRRFYIRAAADFIEMPYEILKRMFAGSESPILSPVFDGRLVTREPTGAWRVPLIVGNSATRAAEQADFSVTIINPDACDQVTAEGLVDASSLNPGQKLFLGNVVKPIHRGLNHVLGALRVSMKKGKRPRRVLNLDIRIYCSGMRAKKWIMRVQLASKGFSVQCIKEEFLY
jgi:hypothetical protein